MPNSFLMLLYAILKVFIAVLEQSYHNMEQCKLEQQDLNIKHFTSREHLENFLIIILTLAYIFIAPKRSPAFKKIQLEQL